MTPLQLACKRAAKRNSEAKARYEAKLLNPNPEGNSLRYDNYVVLIGDMRKRAYEGKISKRDLRVIAQGNAGDKLRAGRMMLAYLGGQP